MKAFREQTTYKTLEEIRLLITLFSTFINTKEYIQNIYINFFLKLIM